MADTEKNVDALAGEFKQLRSEFARIAQLLGHTMLSFAEMLGRLAVNDPETYPRERLEAAHLRPPEVKLVRAGSAAALRAPRAAPDGAVAAADQRR